MRTDILHDGLPRRFIKRDLVTERFFDLVVLLYDKAVQLLTGTRFSFFSTESMHLIRFRLCATTQRAELLKLREYQWESFV